MKIILIALIVSFAYPDKFIDQMLRERKARENKEKSKKIHKQNRARLQTMLRGTKKVVSKYINKDTANYYNKCIKINNMNEKKLTKGQAFVKIVDRGCYEYAMREVNNKNNTKRVKKDMNIKVSDETINLSSKRKKKKKFKLIVSD